MALSCNCPLDASLPDVLIPQCLTTFGQVNKVIFQRLYDDAGIQNSIPLDGVETIDAWNVFFAAVDSTRMVITPYVYNPTFTAGAKRTFGGGNATPGGRVEVIGAEVTTFTSTINDMAQPEVIKPLKQLMCESALGVYLINETGRIAGIKNGSALQPIPIDSKTLFVGDFAPGGFENPDTNALEWSFKANWSDDLVIQAVEFDPLSDFDTAVDPTIANIIYAAGGTGVTGLPGNTAVSIGDNYVIPTAIPTRPDYNFLGYAASGNKTGNYDPGNTITNITGSVILTAQWEGDSVELEDPNEGYIVNKDGVKTNTFTAESASWINSGVWEPDHGDSAFEAFVGAMTNYQRVRIPEGVTEIAYNSEGYGAFGWDDGLGEGPWAIFPSTLATVGEDGFKGMASGGTMARKLVVQATTPPTLDAKAFGGSPDFTENLTIRVPSASVAAYKSAWSEAADCIEAIQPGDVP